MAVRELKQERAERTRATLLRAAAEVFAKNGFAGASVTRIAEQAGLTLGAMYFHFKSKEDLAREIVTSQPDYVVPPLPAQGLQRVIDLTLAWAYQLRDDPLLQASARLVMDQQSFLEPTADAHQQWMELLVSELRVAQRRGELRAGVDIEAYARLIESACTGAQMHSQLRSDRRDLAQRVEQMWQCLLPVMVVPSAAKKMRFGEERGKAS